MDCRSHANGEEHAGGGFGLPTQIGVSLAGIPVEIDGGADGGPQVAAEGPRPRRKEDLEVRIGRGALDAEAAPQARNVVVERPHFELADAEQGPFWRISHGG